jgi:Ca2+-binding RTX toxin-like protein
LFGDAGDDGTDILTGGDGADIFVITQDSTDTITDLNVSEDKLQITDLLELPLNIDVSDYSAIETYLNEAFHITDGHIKINDQDIATYGADSSFNSNDINAITAGDSISLIYQEHEYHLIIDE